jgi:hypothetical protein
MSQIRYCLIPLLGLAVIVGVAVAQTQFIGTTNFPAELEFNELHEIKSDIVITDDSALAKVPDGKLFIQAGFSKYLSRSYALPNKQMFVIEDVMLKDSRTAYSLVTLLRKSELLPGPPGDVYSIKGNSLLFAKGGHFIRMEDGSSSIDLLERVATSISNRVGPSDQTQPILIKHLPNNGMEPSTLRYFLGPLSSAAFTPTINGKGFKSESDIDVAQADYKIGNQQGTLSLINFPTIQLAEDYFDNSSGSNSLDGRYVFLKRAGPLVGVLEGSFDRTNATSILKPVEYKYSVRWIYDKNNRSTGAVMGIPVGILGTVVRSIVLTMLLCGVSLLAGAGIAIFRLLLRKYAPNNYLDRPERTELIRLKIDEN